MKHAPLVVLSLGSLVPCGSAQWSTPTVVANINSAGSDVSPAPTRDGLTLYFSSNQMSSLSWDLFRTTRTTPYGAFATPTHIVELSSTGTDAGPYPRIDDCEIFWQSTRPGGPGGLDIWRATRATPALPWGTPTPVVELSTSASETSPTLTIDGLRIYFATTAGGNYDIWTATRPSWTAPFGTPTPVPELNTTATDYGPCISPDGLTIFFASDRTGSQSNDIYVATRLLPNAPFGNVARVADLSGSASDYWPAFAMFHDEIFFSSSRVGTGPGGFDIHSSRYTGISGNGFAGQGGSRELRFSDPSSPGLVYVAASALGNTPGIPLGGRLLPLNPDPLLQVTVGGLPPVLNGYSGLLNSDGVAAGKITFAGFPQLVGFRFFTAFLVLDATAPFGLKTISDAHEVLVQ